MLRDKNKERERRKRENRKYGQAQLKHAKKGVISCVIAASVLIVLVLMLIKVYTSRGTATAFIGGLGLVSLIVSLVGCIFGYKGFREREKNYLTCKMGMGCNICIIFIYIAIFFRGLF